MEEFYNARDEFKSAVESLAKYVENGPPEKKSWFQELQSQAQNSYEKANSHVEGNFRRDYYKIFNVAPTATDEEINRGFKRKALLWHPDKH